MLPILVDRVAPSDQRELYAGLLVAAAGAFNSIGQVGFAWIADRVRSVSFMWKGLAGAAVGISLVGLAPNLFVMIALLLVGGLGIAAFHPPSAMAANRLSIEAKGVGMSIFICGGNLGQAAGPLLLMVAYERWSNAVFLPAMIPGLLMAAAMAALFYYDAKTEKRPKPAEGAPVFNKPLIILWTIVTLRTLTTIGFLNFLSIHLKDEGMTDVARSLILSGYLLFGSVGMLLGGYASDKFSRNGVLIASLLLPAPLFLGALALKGPLFLTTLFAGNFLLQLTTPVYIVIGQETTEQPTNLATSMVMGGAWGAAAVLNLPAGAAANQIGIVPMLSGLAFLPLICLALLTLLPSRLKHPKSA
ncbi:MAG: MFS transporter [Candidatus Poribacteria bacterium]|nr:MFS transporter [Candidatus Poribacteria bacterium]